MLYEENPYRAVKSDCAPSEDDVKKAGEKVRLAQEQASRLSQDSGKAGVNSPHFEVFGGFFGVDLGNFYAYRILRIFKCTIPQQYRYFFAENLPRRAEIDTCLSRKRV